MIRSTKGPHTDPTLERLLSSVDAYVPRQLVGARKSPITCINGTGIGSLMDRSLAGTIGILARLDGNQFHGSRIVLIHLTQDLVTLTCCLIVFRQTGF